MIDKLDLRVPQGTPFRPEVEQFVRGIGDGAVRFKGSRHYIGVANLKPIGIDAMLHAFYRWKTPKNHKLEILDVGSKTFSELNEQIDKVFDTNPEHLGIMRLDLCADIEGTHVSWFQPRARVKFKRCSRQNGELKYEIIGKGGVETLTAGSRPNLVRFYDKVAESKEQFKALRKPKFEKTDSDFEKLFGFTPHAVVTRIERQYGGGRIPEALCTFGDLVQAPDHNPFDTIEIITGSDSHLPSVAEAGLNRWLTGMQINTLANELGMQQFRAFINKHSGGNAARYLRQYHEFLPGQEDVKLTTEGIFNVYRDSTIKQLSA